MEKEGQYERGPLGEQEEPTETAIEQANMLISPDSSKEEQV